MAVINGTNANDKLVGTHVSDSIRGFDGNDSLYGGLGNDMLNGGTGNDKLDGGSGNDTLYGGEGNDVLHGGQGNDTYAFHLGDGHDIVHETDHTPGNLDKIVFDNSISKDSIAVFQQGNDLKIAYGDSTDTITVTGQKPYMPAVERFELKDGSYLTAADVNSVIQSMSNYAVDHGIAFNNIKDVENNANLMAIVNSAWHH